MRGTHVAPWCICSRATGNQPECVFRDSIKTLTGLKKQIFQRNLVGDTYPLLVFERTAGQADEQALAHQLLHLNHCTRETMHNADPLAVMLIGIGLLIGTGVGDGLCFGSHNRQKVILRSTTVQEEGQGKLFGQPKLVRKVFLLRLGG